MNPDFGELDFSKLQLELPEKTRALLRETQELISWLENHKEFDQPLKDRQIKKLRSSATKLLLSTPFDSFTIELPPKRWNRWNVLRKAAKNVAR